MKNLVRILSLESKLSGKFQRFNTIGGSIKMLKNSWISKNVMKNCQTFYYILWTKVFLRRYTEMYRHLLSKCFKNAVLGCQEIVQCKCFFWHQTEICLLENGFLAVLWEHIIFNVKWVEVHKMGEVFWAKLYCKMSDLFR